MVQEWQLPDSAPRVEAILRTRHAELSSQLQGLRTTLANLEAVLDAVTGSRWLALHTSVNAYVRDIGSRRVSPGHGKGRLVSSYMLAQLQLKYGFTNLARYEAAMVTIRGLFESQGIMLVAGTVTRVGPFYEAWNLPLRTFLAGRHILGGSDGPSGDPRRPVNRSHAGFVISPLGEPQTWLAPT